MKTLLKFLILVLIVAMSGVIYLNASVSIVTCLVSAGALIFCIAIILFTLKCIE